MADEPDGTRMEFTVPAARDLSALLSNRAEVEQALIREIGSWQGVSVDEHRFGGVEFRIGRRELGHLHATFADLPFPRHIRDELVAHGRARPHHVLPDSGWVTVPMRTAQEAANVVELFRQNYERTGRVSSEE